MQAIKPVITGWGCVETEFSDTGKIIRSLGLNVTPECIEKVSPWRFAIPSAPNVAAASEGKTLDYDKILTFCNQTRNKAADYVFIEGSGGIMSPISKDKCCIDLIRDLKIDVILVVGSYLGAISHILTALAALKDVRRVHVILTLQRSTDEYYRDIIDYISQYSGHHIYVQEFIESTTDCPWTLTSQKIVDFLLR